MEERINVVFTIDNAYVQHLCVALQSLLSNNPSTKFKIYIISEGLVDKNLSYLKKFTSNYQCEIFFIIINDKIFDNLVLGHHFQKATYYRLLIPEFVNENKILYLDSDLIVTGSIKELYQTNLEDYYVAAVEDPGFDRHLELKMRLDSHYFNAGVMLLNLKLWKETQLHIKVVDFISSNPSVVRYADQDGLNAIIDGKWKKMHLRYNQLSVLFEEDHKHVLECFSNSEIEESRKSPVIVHFTGAIKPWDFRSNHPYKYLYYQNLKKTSFKWFVPENLTIKNILKKLIPGKIKIYIRNIINQKL
jgi:lipopolysaccharide biosynthesis glycosyltransferase